MSYKYFGQTINGSASVLYGTHHFAFGVDIPDPVVQTPYIIFRFQEGISPRSIHIGTWKQIETSQYNDWEWSCEAYPDQYYVNNGWQFAFSSNDGTAKLKYSSYGEVDIIGWGNLDTIETTDRMFYNCDAIVNVPNIFVNGFIDGVLVDCASMFNGCTRIDSTQELELYNTIKNFTHIPTNHSQMFANTNATAMASIPVSWGGTYVTPGVKLENTLNSSKNWCWHINNFSGLDMSTLSSVEIYTTASVSQYAGVNRRKSNIKWASGTTANRSNPIYYYPCIATISNSAASTPPTAIQHAFITTNYNGILTGSTTAGDMPGTLDPAATGPLAYEIGTYDASTSGTYCFGFLVTQFAPSEMSALTSLNYNDCHYGFLNNSYFSANAPLYYSPDTIVEK